MNQETPIHRVEVEQTFGPATFFSGDVTFELVHSRPDLAQLRVHFHDGAHTHWHLHTGDQVLYFVEGKGMAQGHDGPVIECQPGDIIHVPPGTRHLHGALPGHDATHIAVTEGEAIWEDDPRYPRP